jgi:hypothetical protein
MRPPEGRCYPGVQARPINRGKKTLLEVIYVDRRRDMAANACATRRKAAEARLMMLDGRSSARNIQGAADIWARRHRARHSRQRLQQQPNNRDNSNRAAFDN